MVTEVIPVDGMPTLFVVEPGADLRTMLAKNNIRGDEVHSGTVSVDAYLDTDDQSVQQNVLAVLDVVLDAMGFDGPFDIEVQAGSIFRRPRAALKKGIESAELPQRLAKVERALELAYLDRHQAEVDATKAAAVQQLLESLENVPQACIRIGSILLLKFEDSRGPVVLIRTLSQLEIHALERYPESKLTREGP